jgi:hypothetical protein
MYGFRKECFTYPNPLTLPKYIHLPHTYEEKVYFPHHDAIWHDANSVPNIQVSKVEPVLKYRVSFKFA